MDIALVTSLIIGCISSILLLNKYRKSERIAIYILIQFILWFVNSIYVFLSMMLMHTMFHGIIDDIKIYVIGCTIGIYLVPVYAFCINKNKGNGKLMCKYIFISTVIFIILLAFVFLCIAFLDEKYSILSYMQIYKQG